MRIAIVDDEVEWINKEQRIIEECFEEDKIDEIKIETYLSGEEFLQSGKAYDIVIMDIEFQDKQMDGFSYVKSYQEICQDFYLIIMTTHTEFSRKGYHVNAFRYIDKMYIEELTEAIDKIKEISQESYIEVTVADVNLGKSRINCENIQYMEAQNHVVNVHMKEQTVCVKETIKEILQKVSEKGFYPVHRSYIVNFEAIEYYTENSVYMCDKANIPISRRRYKEFQREYFQWQMNRANK